MNYLQQRAAAGEVVTGLLYIDPAAEDLHRHLNTVDAPLNQLGTRELCPGVGRAGTDQRFACANRASAPRRRR